tara:strand:+ start:63 stop:1001 length:939 start_codon:yes stop_codon:yes gene_type:complete
MPLVDLGSDKEKGQWDTHAGYGSTNTKTQYYTNEVINEISSLGTVANNSTYGWSFTASQNVRVTAIQVISSSAGGAYFGWSLNASDATASIESLTYANGKLLVEGNQSANGLVTIPITTLMKAGDVLRPQGGGSTIDNLQSYQSMNIVVEKDHSHTNMAHIIKPAVCILKDVKPAGTAGGTMGSSAWHLRDLNTIEGESWFLNSLSSSIFSLSPGQYKITAAAPSMKTDASKIRLYDTTNSQTKIEGMNVYGNNSNSGASVAHLEGVFTLTSDTSFKIEHYNATVNSSGGAMGADISGVVSVFTTVRIEKLK